MPTKDLGLGDISEFAMLDLGHESRSIRGQSITDSHGRVFRKLRISVTEACQFRCFYCMPHASPPVMRPGHLDAQGFARIAHALVGAGVCDLRVTGGEPTLRPDLDEILIALGEVGGTRLSITSNGQFLPKHFPALHQSGVRTLNISLDSLRPDSFKAITGRRLEPVLEAVHAAVADGFSVKVNCVVSRGRNDDEVHAFAEFAQRTGVEVRFLELMKIGPGAVDHTRDFVSAAEVESRLATGFGWVPLARGVDETAYRIQLEGGGRIGFIASESKPFCGGCSRLRLSVRGELRSCLMRDDRIPLAGLDAQGILRAAGLAFRAKPTERIERVDQAMHQIGG